MDRSILEGNPHSVIEGMTIGAYAMGARYGYIYVRAEYPLAVEKLKTAIQQAEEHGLLGENILGSGFDFSIDIECGSGAFVCGEETSLIASIMGMTGEPRQRPPFPAESGVWGKPTNINNVKSWANVPLIIARGAGWFSSVGTEASKGTVIFSLVGKVKNTGLVEVPMGTKLSSLVFDIGGGITARETAQGCADRWAIGWLHPRQSCQPDCRLRDTDPCRFNHGIGRHGGDGRKRLHGGRGQVLS